MPLYRRALEIHEKIFGKDHFETARTLTDLAGLYYSQGRYADAGPRLRRALEMRKKIFGENHPYSDKSLINLVKNMKDQALLHYSRGEFNEALRLFQELESISRDQENKTELAISLGSQAIIQQIIIKNPDEAMRLHKEAERIFRELGDKDGLSKSLGHQGLLFQSRLEVVEALRLFKEQERLCREIGNYSGLATTLVNQANLLCYGMGKPKEALPLAQDAYRLATDYGLTALAEQIKPILDSIRREFDASDERTNSLISRAKICHAKGELDEAMRLYKEAECIYREQKNKYGLQGILGNQALILQDRESFDAAMPLLKERVDICREIKYSEGAVRSLMGQASIYARRRMKSETLDILEEVYRMASGDNLLDLVAQVKSLLARVRSL